MGWHDDVSVLLLGDLTGGSARDRPSVLRLVIVIAGDDATL
jgi:hypothetical protein